MQTLLIGVEVGTSAVKAVLYDLAGVEHFATRCAYPLLTPQPGWAEQDADELWAALLTVLRETASAAAAHGHVAALALAAQAGSVVPVDAAGAPLAPLITWLDTRAAGIVAGWMHDGTAERIRRISGWHPHPGLALAILAWLSQQAPDLTRRTARFLDVHGFLLQKLTGRPLTDYSEAAELLLFDHTTRAWSPELCALAGIHSAQLGEVTPAGTDAGSLLPAVAHATGLPAAVRVVVGGQDQCGAALGMGVLAPGQLMLASGTAWVLTALTAAPDLDQLPPAMDLNFHVAPAVYTVSQLLGGFGAVMEWWLKLLWPDVPARFDELAAALAASPPGANDLLFLPLGGSAQMGSGLGGFVGLRLDHTRADMVRAVCEGIAYEVRWALATLTAANLPMHGLWMSGGATHSPDWLALLANVAAMPVYAAPGANWPARGAALLAGVGVGIFPDLATPTAYWRLSLAEILPDPYVTRRIAMDYARYQDAACLLTRLAPAAPDADAP
jgi:xylulokinase